MSKSKRFPAEKIARLDSPERQAMQPAGPLVELMSRFQPQVVLDIGVGTGYFALPLAKALPEARILGLDVEPRMLEVLTERAAAVAHGSRVETVEAPEDSIPLADDSVNLALMANLYHELGDRGAYLQEVKRVLTPGGRLIIADWDPDSKHEGGPPLDHRVPQGTVQQELAAAGFDSATAHALYEPVYTLVAPVRA